MGKGEELHMELEFDRDVIHCWEIVADGTLCQEETLETIVPDACPDILRIVDCEAMVCLKGKEAQEGRAEISGSVRAAVLYLPDGAEGIRRMGRRLRGFDDPDALLTAPETRSSSPVRILRNETRECPTVRGLFPCGEGAGYAGGITSAAVDGLRCAEEILKQSL